MNEKLQHLDPKNHSEVIAFLRKAFSDYFEFDDTILPLLKRILEELPRTGITTESTRTLMERVGIDVDNVTSPEQKKQNDRIKIVLTTCYVLLLASTAEMQSLCYTSTDQLIQDFDSFASITDLKELQYLLAFRNYLVIALRIVPAKGNKIFLLKVIERLEGSEEEYITGTGQKPAVTRRISIYEKEGNIKAKTYKNGSNSNNNSSANLVDLANGSGSDKKMSKRKRQHEQPAVSVYSQSVAMEEEVLEDGGIDGLWNSPPSTLAQPASIPTFPPLVTAPPETAVAMTLATMSRHFSDVAAGIPHLDSNSHNKLLHETYKGSFTEFIEQSDITM